LHKTYEDADCKGATAEAEAKDFCARFVISAKKVVEVQDVAFQTPPKRATKKGQWFET